jgi:superfamily II DNA or RNA helicase
MPVSWKGTLAQYTGRLHRLHSGKIEVRIFDYVDSGIPILVRMFEKRLRAYRTLGYARSDVASDNPTPIPEQTVEYDEDLIRGLEDIE